MIPQKLKRGDRFALIFDRWNKLVDYLHEIRLVPGRGINIARLPSGIVISSSTAPSGRGGSVAADVARGPFGVTVEDDGDGVEPAWKVRLRNTAGSSRFAGMVTIGSHRRLCDVQTWDAREGVVYMDITCDDESDGYRIVFALEDELPATADERRFVLRIADIAYDSEADIYTATQVRPVGDIEVLGRWVK